MSWDEKLFGAVYRAIFHKTREVNPHAALLEPQRTRLAWFASAVAETKIEVGPSEGDGGRSGTRLLLPEALAITDDASLNERAYLVRVAFDATAIRLGLVPAHALTKTESLTFARLSVPLVLTALFDELPGLRPCVDRLAPHVVAARPTLGRLSPAALDLELLTRMELAPADNPSLLLDDAEAILRATRLHDAIMAGKRSLTELTASIAARLGEGELPSVPLWGAVSYDATHAVREVDATPPPEATGTERRGKTREGVRRITLDDAPLEDNPMVHSFEKVHTVEAYTGGRKNVDGGDELGEHGEALDDVAMREVVRSRERASSLYRAEVSFEDEAAEDADVAEPEGSAGIPYDEWDERTRTYKKDHCRVFVTLAPRARDAAAASEQARRILRANARTMTELEARFERIERARRERGREPDGPDIDADAIVDRYATLAAGHTGDDRLYVARRPHVQDLAVMILLDASLSSDAWVQGKRVLDVTKEAILVLGEALDRLTAKVSVAAFFSNTRRDCRFTIVKTFDAEFRGAIPRLATVSPTGYTRIGPALRHGAHVLDETGARKKLLVMIGDGKPTDFDRYEGRYGTYDVRRAVREAEERGIHVFALAVDQTARRQLPVMFGPKGFEILRRPSDLVGALGRLSAELAR